MSAPSDVFTTKVSPAQDVARGALADVGLRPNRVFLVMDTWSGDARRREGSVSSTVYTELTPTPKVRFASANMVAHSGGEILFGTVFLEKISRVTYTANQLQGKDSSGNNLAKDLEFSIAIKPLGTLEAELYRPSSLPVLLSTSFSMVLRPQNERRVLPIGTTTAEITADP